MWLLVGLGNPGRQYARNRHNIGFRVVDEVARRHGFAAPRGKFGGDVTSGMIGREKVIVLKPMEYMNLSGYAVQRAVQFHDVDVERIIVVHDEIDLDFGRLRLKTGGGHGGSARAVSCGCGSGSASPARRGPPPRRPAPRAVPRAAASATAGSPDTC
jgi:peptidyl-tRNA hydrolase, PTH1 family